MGNEATKLQIKNWLADAVRRAQNPDPLIKARRRRKSKKIKVAKKYRL